MAYWLDPAAAHLGFTGKAAIHPAQLGAIHQAFTPAEEQVSYARQVVAAYQASPTGVTVLEGRLVEKPVVDRMQRIRPWRGRQAKTHSPCRSVAGKIGRAFLVKGGTPSRLSLVGMVRL